MTEDMGIEVSSRRAPLAAVVVTVLLLSLQSGIAQESSPEGLHRPGNLTTSTNGSLQTRLAAAYERIFARG